MKNLILYTVLKYAFCDVILSAKNLLHAQGDPSLRSLRPNITRTVIIEWGFRRKWALSMAA